MADVFQISVVLAIVYLARFIFAHESQAEEDRFYFDDFQRGESSSAIEDSNENIPLQSEESFAGKLTHERVWSEEDDRDVESNEKVLIQSDDPFRGSQAAWFEEEKLVESNEDNMSYENVPIKSGILLRKSAAWFEKDRITESSKYDPLNENMRIKSGAPLRERTIYHTDWFQKDEIEELNEDNPSSEKVLIQSGVPLRGRTRHHEAWPEKDEIVELNEDNPSNGKVLIKTGDPLRKGTSHSEAWPEEDKIAESNQDTEKVLIRSSAPLRGRTIHHTAWSEEEKITESKEDATQERTEKSIYDSWSLTKAFNYILSFIYDVEEDGAIVQTTAEEAKQTLKSQNGDFPEFVVPQSQSILDRQKEIPGTLSAYNQAKYSIRGTTANSLTAVYQNHDTEWIEGGGGDFDNGDEYFDLEFSESLFQDKDYDQEYEFLNLFEDGERVGVLQGNPRKNIDSNLLKVKEKEMKVQETGRETKVANKPTRSLKNSVAEKQSKDNVNPTTYLNQKLTGHPDDTFARVGGKESNENVSGQVENQNGEVLPSEKNSSKLKLIENDPKINKGTTESIVELESNLNYGTPVNFYETEFPQDKKKESTFHTASNNIKTVSFDTESSVEITTIKSVPITETTHQQQSQIRKGLFKTKTPDHSSQKHLQSASSIPKKFNQHKEPSFKFDHQVKNSKIKSPITGSNQERNHKVNANYATAQTKNEALKIPPNSIGDTAVTTEQLKSKRNKENNVARFQNVMSPKKPTKENGAGHSNPKINALRDSYPDFEVQENVASYNYILDSGEFIGVNGNGQNKVNKKQNNSIFIPVKNGKEAATGKIAPISSGPTVPLKDQNEPEIFGTILEYLYKYSNSTLLLSLREYNSSES